MNSKKIVFNEIDKLFNSLAMKEHLETIKKINNPISEITRSLIESSDKLKATTNSFANQYQKIIESMPIPKIDIYFETIKRLLKINNGYITSQMVESLCIGKKYLPLLEKNKEIERISRGIYISKTVFEDSYYIFQLKYSKVIFSHMNALYFHGLTEEFPSDFTVTVPYSYHAQGIGKNNQIFYVDDNNYMMGVEEIKTPNGNIVRAYDVERSICDIIRSKKRMDIDIVKKSVKSYVKRKDKNITKLSDYAEKLGVKEEVMDFVGMFYE